MSDISESTRFEFGANWARFLSVLDEERIARAVDSIAESIGPDLTGKTFLDAGCGSGLFSLAARRMGAVVHSFDFDSVSVACARELKRRYFPLDTNWKIEQGSVLDMEYLFSLGVFDVVYSWGVLHHTGDLWKAIGNVESHVAPQGVLFISIYNDQGARSRRWLWIKRTYIKHRLLRAPLLLYTFVRCWGMSILLDAKRGVPLSLWRDYKSTRGMSPWRDLVDWTGGYPFEVAKPEEVFDFLRERGFHLKKLRTCGGGLGCNEFVFSRAEPRG